MHKPLLIYIDCDVPAGMTLTEWRRAENLSRRQPRRPVWRRILAI